MESYILDMHSKSLKFYNLIHLFFKTCQVFNNNPSSHCEKNKCLYPNYLKKLYDITNLSEKSSLIPNKLLNFFNMLLFAPRIFYNEFITL